MPRPRLPPTLRNGRNIRTAESPGLPSLRSDAGAQEGKRGGSRTQPRPASGLSAVAGPRPRSAFTISFRGSKCRDVWPPRAAYVLFAALATGRAAVLLPGAPASSIVPVAGGQTNAPPRIKPRRGRCVGLPTPLGLASLGPTHVRGKKAKVFGRIF